MISFQKLFLKDDAEISVHDQFKSGYHFLSWLQAFIGFMSSLWNIIMIVITSFKVGTFSINGLLGHPLNVNKDIYNFFP